MTISSGDIHLRKTQVMLDTPDGGGAATANDVPDGASNAVFLDVSETDRALGRVNLRKLVVHVVTNNVDEFLGCNVIIAEQPNDPNVSMTLFSTGETFDRRADAVSRIEAYLAEGPAYQGYLYGTHVQGQMTLLMFQKTDRLLPTGTVLVLTKRQGYSDEVQQFVRVTESSGAMQTFEDDRGQYQRFVMALKISSPLRADFPGLDMSRFEYTKAQLAAATKISETVVADAARYYGAADLEIEGAIGDYIVKAKTSFTQLVPSAQVETPILDARTNQTIVAAVQSGGDFTISLPGPLAANTRRFVGGAITPGTLRLTYNASNYPVATDQRGALVLNGVEYGQVDYANGVLTIFNDPMGAYAYTVSAVYKPAAAPTAISQSQGFEVTQLNRSLNYIRTLEPPPVPGTLAVSYMAQGQWYVLSDRGDGALVGTSVAHGAGSVNGETGTVLVTLGALPDVGSAIIFTWLQPTAARGADMLQLDNNGKLYWPLNTSGEVSISAGSKAIEPGGLSIAWNDGTARTATDDGNGNITGAATGTVNYALGVIRLSPNVLPPKGTPITMTLSTRAKSTGTATIASGSGSLGATDITPGSVEFVVTAQLKGQYLVTGWVDWGGARQFRITDDGAGNLRAHLGDRTLTVGTINYAAGTFALSSSVAIPGDMVPGLVLWDNVYFLVNEPANPVWRYEVA